MATTESLLNGISSAAIASRLFNPRVAMLDSVKRLHEGSIVDINVQNRLLPNGAEEDSDGFGLEFSVVIAGSCASESGLSRAANDLEGAASSSFLLHGIQVAAVCLPIQVWGVLPKESKFENQSAARRAFADGLRAGLLRTLFGKPLLPQAFEFVEDEISSCEVMKHLEYFFPNKEVLDRVKLATGWSAAIACMIGSSRVYRLTPLQWLMLLFNVGSSFSEDSVIQARTSWFGEQSWFPKPICALCPRGDLFILPETVSACRTFAAATDLFSSITRLCCSTSGVSDELHTEGCFPAFQTSSEEAFHTVSTLIHPLAEAVEGAFEQCVTLGVRYSPLANDVNSNKAASTGFVSAPPPSPPFERFHVLLPPSHELSSPLASAELQQLLVSTTPASKPTIRISNQASSSPSTFQEDDEYQGGVWVSDAAVPSTRVAFQLVTSIAELKMISSFAVSVIPLIDLFAGEWTLGQLISTLRQMHHDRKPFGFYCVEPHGVGSGNPVDSWMGRSSAPVFSTAPTSGDDIVQWIAAFVVASGASYVWIPPPRGGQVTSLYNEFLRLEEYAVQTKGYSHLHP